MQRGKNYQQIQNSDLNTHGAAIYRAACNADAV